MTANTPVTVVAYIPVIHRGYLTFLSALPSGSTVWVMSEDVRTRFHHLRKDIRALTAAETIASLQPLLPELHLAELNEAALAALAAAPAQELLMPDEDIMRELAASALPKHQVEFRSVFLRWDRQKSLAEQAIETSEEVTTEALAQTMIASAYREAALSTDWWRQVGGVVAKDGQTLFTAHNLHLPSEIESYYAGDPRGNFHKGDHIELSTAIHAEAGLIAQAAAKGVSLTGCDLYVTTFPCPPCAKLVAHSGIARIFFAEGYAMIEGDSLLREHGVKLVRVVPTPSPV